MKAAIRQSESRSSALNQASAKYRKSTEREEMAAAAAAVLFARRKPICCAASVKAGLPGEKMTAISEEREGVSAAA